MRAGMYMLSNVKNFIITFCVSVLIFGLIAYLIINFAMSSVFQPKPSDQDTAPPLVDNGDDTSQIDTSKIAGTSFTALLIGTDYQPDVFPDYNVTELNQNRDGFPVRARAINADTLILVRIDKEDATFVLSALPSNMQVTVGGNKTTLGALYSDNGIDYLCDMVKSITGYTVDYYAVSSIPDFAAIVDLIDGVSFTVPTSMHYEDPTEGLVINLSAGKRTLNGSEAMQMLRYCSYADGNISRMSLSIDFVQAMLSKLTAPEYHSQAVDLLRNISDHVITNFTSAALTENLDLIYSYPSFTVTEITYPGSYQTADGITVFVPRTSDAIQEYLKYR